MFNQISYLILVLFCASSIEAQTYSTGEILIEDSKSLSASPLVNNKAFKTEEVSQEKMEDPFRQTLSDLVKDQPGLDTQVYCANCGAKRLTINGLKGEHTSILVDGLPLHSAVSSFYGVDNVPILGLRKVEVMRGAGASLSNPEAIGGTLNLLTVDPFNFTSKIRGDFIVNDDQERQGLNANFLVGKSNENIGLAVGGSFSHSETWDEDNNNLAELPQREGKSFMAKGKYQNGPSTYTLRFGYADLEILGGFHDPQKPTRVRPVAASESDFIDGDVNNKFIGDPSRVTDWVELDRVETAFTMDRYIGDSSLLEVKLGQARQEQKAIYQHGFDYANIDNTFVGDISLQHFFSDTLTLKAGLFLRDERLRSASENLFEKYAPSSANDIAKDNFNYSSQAIYSEVGYLKDKWEVNLSLRLDHIDINWLELQNEVKEWIAAPRLNFMYNFNEHLTQRISYGLGYRAPLTFFESGHGNQESGYEVAITDLEKAHSLVYSLSYNTEVGYITGSTHYTHLNKMAYGRDEFNQPIQYVNSNDSYDILVSDLLIGYKPFHELLLEASLEVFSYQDAYKRKLQTAAIEERITLRSTFDNHKWKHTFSAQYVPSRNLSNYGRYNNHYRNRNQSYEPLLDETLAQKNLKAPGFFLFDTNISYQYREDLSFTLAINNILDYTQVSAGDSPQTWHWHFNHAHYDGLHTWGPNAGRQFALGLEYTF